LPLRKEGKALRTKEGGGEIPAWGSDGQIETVKKKV